MGGAANTDGNNLPWGNARSIRQQLTQQDIEDFINQPELFRQLLQPIIELEGALRAQAELDNINDNSTTTTRQQLKDINSTTTTRQQHLDNKNTNQPINKEEP